MTLESMYRERCKVLQNKKVAPGHFVLEMASARISPRAMPGQFVQILCSQNPEPLLPRPFSFLDAGKRSFSVLYHVVGKGTRALSQVKKGESLWVIGPLGRGFSLPPYLSFRTSAASEKSPRVGDFSPRHSARLEMTDGSSTDLVLVGGGVGIPPLYHLARVLRDRSFPKDKIHVFLGARNRSLLLCEKDFEKLGVGVEVATDDGSKGRKGRVTAILEAFAKTARAGGARIYTCGPTPMLRAVSGISKQRGLPCEVSVEVPMACGFGACLGCAIRVHDSKTGHRFAVACVEGPVFDGKAVAWE